MGLLDVSSFVAGHWLGPDAHARDIADATTDKIIARAGRADLDVPALLSHARDVGGPALRAMTFHARARMLKALATALNARKQELYDLSFATGATQSDHLIDVDGGIGTMFVFASKGRREMPDAQIYLDGTPEMLSRDGDFLGQHICTPRQGVAVHINAFNFPVWGMLEKLAPTLLAGMPAIVKPATATSYVTEHAVRIMLEADILPQGALQLVTGGLGDTLRHLDGQDVVSFTGSAATALHLKSERMLLERGVRFMAEQDSLNATVLGPDARLGTPEFDLFVNETIREMTTKAGQKCTAIRRILAPQAQVSSVIEALTARLARVQVGDPRDPATTMGALVSQSQKHDVLEKAALIGQDARCVHGDPQFFAGKPGAFVQPMLFHCDNPHGSAHVHDTEAFGPVATVMGYDGAEDAVTLLGRGKGSLVASVITHDGDFGRTMTLGSAAHHGRLYFNNRDSAKGATGHGSPLPHMVHGGPGRAGGGEELGGVRGVMHYMQRTAVQGSPDMLTSITGQWVPGARAATTDSHPFTRGFHDLHIGDTLHTAARQVTLDDIETFAHFTGDTFYAHMDEDAAARNPFFPGRVAHGYLLISFAAGLFVEPNEGPVLANTGLDNLRFMKPVVAGDHIKVQLTVKHKTPRNDSYGEVRWHVALRNQEDEAVAEYELLTMNAYAS